MKYLTTILLCCFLVFACNDFERPKQPDNLISKEKMSDIIYDLYVINAAKGINRNVLNSNGIKPEEYILKKHNIDSIQFVNSNRYYAYDSETYKTILTVVKTRIEQEKSTYDALLKKEEAEKKKKRDSIRNLNTNKKPKSLN